MSKIEWCTKTSNPVVGCTKGLSKGCDNCFAHSFFPRLKGMGIRLYKDMKDFSDIKWDLNILGKDLESYKKPEIVFIGSMGDLFHEKVPTKIIDDVLTICMAYPQHQFIILTKRYERLIDYINANIFGVSNNVHFGISVCDSDDLEQWLYLLFVINALKEDYSFIISLEPLLEYLDKEIMDEIIEYSAKWIIVGAETGNKKRPFKEEWALEIRDLCKQYNVPFFFKKQYINGKETNLLGGKEYLEFPKEFED